MNTIMQSIRNIIWEYCYVDMEPGAPIPSKHVMSIIKIMKRHSLDLPQFIKYIQYSFEKNDGWGDYIDRMEYLS